MEPLSLLAGGQDSHAYSQDQWEKIAAAVLRKSGKLTEGDPDDVVWSKLTRTTLDGIPVSPLGTAELVADLPATGLPGQAPFTRGREATRNDAWDIRPLFCDPDAKATAADVLTDLENGATSVWLQLGAAGIPVAELTIALEKVLFDVAPVTLDAGPDALAAAQAFAELVKGKTLAVGTNLGVDPIGASIRHNAEATGDVAEVAKIALEIGSLAAVVDGTAVHDIGASDGQELGYSLAVGAAYLRALVAAGHDVATAAGLIEFRYAVTDEQFPSIAKLRAARRLWARVLELSDVPAEQRGQRQHAVTSRPMMSKYDPWVNMLRTCVASFAAGVGGADAVTVLPFDAPLGLPDAFARRIARNTSSLLISESHVAKVADPGGGAYAIEKLTDDLAVAGWAEFGRIESAKFGGHGGIEAALADGSLLGRIEVVVAEREAQIARRKRPLTGLTEFPNLHETLPERRPYADGAIPVKPYGHAFETMRDEPATSKIFLATLGTVAAHTARATFASNLFAAGGIDTVNPGRNDDVPAVLKAYAGPDGGQQVVCLVGNDKAYAEWGTDLVAALREAGATYIILAGKPIDGLEADDTCAMGVDALDFLRRTRETLA